MNDCAQRSCILPERWSASEPQSPLWHDSLLNIIVKAQSTLRLFIHCHEVSVRSVLIGRVLTSGVMWGLTCGAVYAVEFVR